MDSKKPNISVVLSVLNEVDIINNCLESVKWADEIILVDNGSSDGTIQFAKKFGAKIYQKPNNIMLNINKNFGLSKATGDWILYLDGDEEILPELKVEILQTVENNSEYVGYWIPRKNIIFGKWIRHGIWWPDNQLRLFKNGFGRYPEKHVHEYITVDGPTDILATPFIHYNYRTVSAYLQKMSDIYTENEVANLIASGYRPVWSDAFRFPISDFNKIYFAQKCYLDGLHGLVLSLMQAFYSFIVFAKLWEKNGFFELELPLDRVNEEMIRNKSEISYWMTSVQIDDDTNPLQKLLLKFIRRIYSGKLL